MSSELESILNHPPQSARPMFRYWFPPNAQLDLDFIRRDMCEICENGFGGAELKCEGGGPDIVELGTERWQAALTAAMETLDAYGCRADLGNTAGQFIDSPAIRSLEDPGAAQELDYSKIEIPTGSKGVFAGTIPLPAQAPPMKGNTIRTKETLVCVTAGVLLQKGVLDAESLQDVSELCTIENETVKWTVPDDRPWILFFHWKRARNETQDTRLKDGTIAELPLLDFYSKEASQRFIDHWLSEMMTPRMRELAAKMHSCLFSDNVENAWERLQWSNSREIFASFSSRHGYDLAPFLPLLYRDGGGFIPESDPHYVTQDPAFGSQVYRNYCETMTELYVENHLKPVQAALASAGMRLRCQTPYGSLRQEQTLPACFADIPETESLWMGDSIDGYRAAAGVVHMSGKELFSSEIGAQMGQSNRQTWLNLCHQVERSVIGGVNLAVLHGYGYSGKVDGTFWPGWSCMAPYFSNDWGPRTPQWAHASCISAYISRLQAIAQWGRPLVDLAIMRLSYKTPRCPEPTTENDLFPSDCLSGMGYSYEYVSPALIEQYENRFFYKALLVSDKQMSLESVKNSVEAIRKKGIPVLVYGATDGAIAAEDTAMQLAQQGIFPYAKFETHTPELYTLARTSDQESAVIIYNTANTPVSTAVHFASCQSGRVVDLWSGEESRLFGATTGNLLNLRLPSNTLCAVILDNSPQEYNNAAEAREIPLKDWTLTLTQWLPGEYPNESTMEVSTYIMAEPQFWTKLAGKEAAPGIGVYEATFRLPQAGYSNAQLILSRVSDTFDVTVNGIPVKGANQTCGTACIGKYLKSGENTLSVRITSPLYNRLTAIYPDQYGNMPNMDGSVTAIPKQEYGFCGAMIRLYNSNV